ncbi:hypothetical protein CBS101457_006555 [Exobasidium rhododendri]|nr:hypothetical protein CBS101457_006555 [Exobasidium rhododendri]
MALLVSMARSSLTNLWIVVAFPLGNVHVISLLVTLNAEHSSELEERQKGHHPPKEPTQTKPGAESDLSDATAARPICKERTISMQSGQWPHRSNLDYIYYDDTAEFLKDEAYNTATRPSTQAQEIVLTAVSSHGQTSKAASARNDMDSSNATIVMLNDITACGLKTKDAVILGNYYRPPRRYKADFVKLDSVRPIIGKTIADPPSVDSNHRIVEVPLSPATADKKAHNSSSFSSLLKRSLLSSRDGQAKIEDLADASSELRESSDSSFRCRGLSIDCLKEERYRGEETPPTDETATSGLSQGSVHSDCLDGHRYPRLSPRSFCQELNVEADRSDSCCIGRTSTLSYENASEATCPEEK